MKNKKPYYRRSTFGPQYEVGDLVMVFNPTIKTGQTKKFKSFYSGPQVTREIINDLIFVIEDVKTKKQQKVHYDRLKRFNSRSATTDKKEPKKGNIEPRITQNDLTEDNDFAEIELVTPKLNDTERREVQPERIISQINPNTETHNETVKDESFQTPMGRSTIESKILTTTIRAEAQRYLRPK